MDVTATGAFPLLLSLTLGVEKEPTGNQIIEGINREARSIGLDPNQVLMENTEDNFQTVQTGAGLTVVVSQRGGAADWKNFARRFNRSNWQTQSG